MHTVELITPPRHGDHRGFLGETYSGRQYAEMGIDVEFVQDNHSLVACCWDVTRVALSGSANRAGEIGALWTWGYL